ncbi:MAG: copper resistance protein CopC [Chloroflexi bacterium]|nr:copper resistance protein CopC [Chloroflexota bacterium]
MTLVAASPEPDAVLAGSPAEVRLTFNQPLQFEGSAIRVENADGQRVSARDLSIEGEDDEVLRVSINEGLREGVYTIIYAANRAQRSGPIVDETPDIVGTYSFRIQFPPPQLAILSPADGESFPPGPVPIELTTEFFEISEGQNEVQVIINGEPWTRFRAYERSIVFDQPGVYTLDVRLARSEDDPLPETTTRVHIAVEAPAAEAVADPSSVITVNTTQRILLAILAVALLGLGYWLGLRPDPAPGA